jgi:hypothetical protein
MTVLALASTAISNIMYLLQLDYLLPMAELLHLVVTTMMINQQVSLRLSIV